MPLALLLILLGGSIMTIDAAHQIANPPAADSGPLCDPNALNNPYGFTCSGAVVVPTIAPVR